MPLHKDLTGADLHEPKPHKTSHENGGSDEISVAGLSGLLADAQTPTAHTLDSHSDVDTTGVADGDVLTYSAGTWAPAEPSSPSGSGALVLLEQHTASASAQLDFTAFISATYDDYVIRIVNLRPATNTVDLQMRMMTGGGTPDTGNNYTWTKGTSSGGTGGVASSSGLVSFIQLGNSWNNTANWGINGHVDLFNPGGALYKGVEGTLIGMNAGARFRWHLMGHYEQTTAVDGVRFFFSSGNIDSGTIRIYGVAKT